MLVFLPLPAGCEFRGMPRSRERHMRSPFKQTNISSSSLEGMERPVRSFKSFIKTVPPAPKAVQKPLPPPPPRKRASTPSPPVSTPSSTSAGRTSSVSSWKAPAEWYNNSGSAASPLPSPPVTSMRTYCPLLPEPSPEISEKTMERGSWLATSTLSSSRLLPIYERPNGKSDVGPSRTPPRSPLPAPPMNNPLNEGRPSLEQGQNMSGSLGAIDSGSQPEFESCFRTVSPADSAHTSVGSKETTKDKISHSLGINSPKQEVAMLENRSYDPESIPPMDRTRADRQYLRDKKFRALNKGSPWADDSWEDMEMDGKTRQMSFSQDYHDLLADQYQEMHVHAAEVLSSGGAHQVYNARFEHPKSKVPPKDLGLVPSPLSWEKSSDPSTPQSSSQPPNKEQPSAPPKKSGVHKRITSWVPHRLTVAPKRRAFKQPSDGQLETDHPPSRQKQIPEQEVDKLLKDDLRFSMFFPPGKHLKFGKKRGKGTNTEQPTKALPLAASHQYASPIMRLPGGLAVIRHSPIVSPKSEAASMRDMSPVSPMSGLTASGSNLGDDGAPSSFPDHRSSFISLRSDSPVAPGIAIRSNSRTSGSNYSRTSGRSSAGSQNHPLSQEIAQTKPTSPALPPAPSHPSSSQPSPPLSPGAWKQLKSHGKDGEDHHRLGFVEKAKQARRRLRRDARQDKLKKSIRVLGPTDPGVVAGYVKRDGRVSDGDSDLGSRLPGYMVSGPI